MEGFDAADRDGDGRLDEEEFNAYQSGVNDPSGEGATNAAGIPATQHQAETLHLFADVDQDGDGYVTGEEFSAKTRNN